MIESTVRFDDIPGFSGQFKGHICSQENEAIEQLLWTMIIKDGGSHRRKQRYLLLY